jgi:predicted deacylase
VVPVDGQNLNRSFPGDLGGTYTDVLGVTTGDVATARPQEHPSWAWLRTPVAGWWEPAVATDECVDAGERLGVVSDLLGVPGTRLLAPVAGVPLFLTSSPAVVPDGLLMGLAAVTDVPAS